MSHIGPRPKVGFIVAGLRAALTIVLRVFLSFRGEEPKPAGA